MPFDKRWKTWQSYNILFIVKEKLILKKPENKENSPIYRKLFGLETLPCKLCLENLALERKTGMEDVESIWRSLLRYVEL